MKIFYFEQYSDEWWAIRDEKMTGSHAQAIGANGAGLKTYIRDDVMLYTYSKAEKVQYNNDVMERGLLLEPQAAMAYEFRTNITTKTVGFIVHNDYVGVSPDRFAGDDGLIEIKCPIDKTYFKLLLDGKIDSKYMWQMQMQMLVCDKKWCDYVVYNPNFKNDLFIKRVFPDEEKFKALERGFESGIKMINEIKVKMGAT